LRKFPFSIVYFVEDDLVVVVSLVSERKRPGYWRAGFARRGERLRTRCDIPSRRTFRVRSPHPHGSELLGNRDVKTTMIYAHVLGLGASRIRSRLDALEEEPTPDRLGRPWSRTGATLRISPTAHDRTLRRGLPPASIPRRVRQVFPLFISRCLRENRVEVVVP
jgi:hypothetical protein